MNPDQAAEIMMNWFAVIIIGVFMLGYVVNMIKDMWRGDDE